MAKGKLSDRQQKMMRFIRRFWQEYGYPPTIREIGEACAISSTSVVNYNLNKLENAGFIMRDGRVSRGIRLTEDSSITSMLAANQVSIPLVGRIFASEPVPVPDASSSFAPDEAINLTRDLVGDGEDLFALEVRGESMIDAMIGDGDIVVMKKQEDAENGDLVAVWLNDEESTTLKHFYFENGRIRLQPANPTMGPIYAEPANVSVQGKVVLVVRQMGAAKV
ncbi:MAG: transcriptional repressor LexA [Anaerolineales bacterium]